MLEHRQGNIALYLIAFSQQIRKKKRQSTCGTLSPLVPTKVLGWLEIKFHWHIISTFFFFKEWFAHIFLPSLSAGSNK